MTSNRITPDTVAVEVDLDEEPITLPDGTVLDETAAEAYGKAVADRAAATRKRGRPSLTGPGTHSPQVSARITPELQVAVNELADREGVRSSEIIRRALEDYVANH
ncbi:ribbon-helix-helix domain-containing protein [Nocardioides sp. ChNu-99]|uniref:ribbon-helix-helix domain-containing protein n=1 Tax=Nocardioides sp. ChNu-99 TaxID=2839897 RepID=UPI002405AC6B|nr:ribbon-helix-helix domain-containing protein [Nocardioides sp. ChNu-99]MDF9716050.1 ribbon-helix-helix domain-containing protein [Nocardioides sp. ChNu-99]